MKHWNRRMGIKILCFILVIPMLAAAIAGGYGLYWLWNEGFYSQEKETLIQQLYAVQIREDGYRMMRDYTEVMNYGDVSEITDLLTDFSNLRYRLTDHTGRQIASNISQGQTHSWDARLLFQVEKEQWISGTAGEDSFWYYPVLLDTDQIRTLEDGQYLLECFVNRALPREDSYSEIRQFLDFGYALRYWGIAIVAACLALAILCLVNLLATASRRPGSDELHPGKFHKVPSDVMALLALIWVAMAQDMVFEHYRPYSSRVSGMVVFAICALITAYMALGLLVGAAGRAKQGCLVRNTLVYKLWRWLGKAGKKLAGFGKECYVNLSLIWKTVLFALAFGLWALLLWLTAMGRSALSVALLLLAPVAMAGMVWVALQLRKLQRGGNALADGDFRYQVDTGKLTGAFQQHGENLNSIRNGMSRALEARLKSERMKTELVTNVSHDIKNPLTSIINYAELIASEGCENPNHREYAQVLGRKSEQLKRLLEDLVEISRASTGNLEVDLQLCDAGTLLSQLSGEFSERCTAAGLTLVTRQPDAHVHIQADSRRIWRVFENLMQNTCKYSLPGSRVYLSLEKTGENAVFTFRNTSKEPLDISPEELMERFVRGDSARTSEGNGLGLSIAQSLTALQGGEMKVTIDGDLFKVTLHFPAVE